MGSTCRQILVRSVVSLGATGWVKHHLFVRSLAAISRPQDKSSGMDKRFATETQPPERNLASLMCHRGVKYLHGSQFRKTSK